MIFKQCPKCKSNPVKKFHKKWRCLECLQRILEAYTCPRTDTQGKVHGSDYMKFDPDGVSVYCVGELPLSDNKVGKCMYHPTMGNRRGK